VAEAQTDRARSKALLENGLAARRSGDRGAALELFLAAARHAPDNPRIACEAASEHLELGQFEDAERLYTRARSLAEDLRPALRGLARLARKRGDRERALLLFKEIAQLDPDSPAAQHDVAMELRELGRIEEAIELGEAIVARQPAFSKAYRTLGHMTRDRGEHRKALGYFRAYADAQADDLVGKADLLRQLCKVGDIDEATALAAELAETPEPSARVLAEIAACHRVKGDRARSIAMLERALALEPGHVGNKLKLAADCCTAWELDKAAAIYEQILATETTNVPALVGLGVVERHRGNARAALEHFKTAVHTGANPNTAISAVLRELRATAQYTEARELLSDLMQAAPQDCNYLFELAKIEHAAANLEQSSRYLAQVVEREPLRIDAYLEYAAVEFKMGRPKRATEILNDALKRSPEHAGVLKALGNYAWAAEGLEKALGFFRRASAAAPTNAAFKWRIARCLLMQGKTAECFETIEQMAKDGPSPDYFRAKISALLQLGDSPAADALLREATEKYPFHAALWSAKTSFDIDLGRYDLVTAALAKPPAYADACRVEMLRGDLMRSQWQLDRAQAHFERAFEHDSKRPTPLLMAAKSALMNVDLDTAQSHLRRWNQVKASELELTGASTKTSQSSIGQILNEFRCEPEGLSRLVEAKSLPPQQCLEALAATARAYPHYTAAAMLLLVELRRQHLLHPKPNAEPPLRSIPPRIVQFWDSDEVPPEVERLSRSWREQNPDMEYLRFSEASARDYLRQFAPEALPAFARAREPALKADLFRLAYLAHNGGFYVDADDRCVAPLSALDWRKYDLVLYQEDWGSIGNNFIAASPQHPIVLRAFEQAVTAISRGDVEMMWLSTGPGLTSRAAVQHLLASSSGFKDGLRGTAILDRYELVKVVSIHCRISYKLTDKHWSRTAFARSRRASHDGTSAARGRSVRRRISIRRAS
jgi:tetratricopeptide (TPR) repeat protein